MPTDKTIEEQNSFQRDEAAMSAIMDANPSQDTPPVETTTAPPPAAPPVEEAKITKDSDKPAQVLPDDPEKLDEYLETFQPKTPDQHKGFPVLKGQIKELSKALKEKEAALKDVEAKSKDIKPITPELEEELNELRLLRRAEDPSKDPEIQAKFLTPISKSNEQAIQILKTHGLKESVIEAITKAGGLSAIANSDQKVPSVVGKDQTWAEWVEEILLPNTPVFDRKRLERLLENSLNLKDEMDHEIEGYKANSEERMKAKFEKMGTEFNTGIEEVAKGLGNMAMKWEAKPGATEEEKSAIQEHNANLDEVIKQIAHFQQNIANPKEVGKMAALAGQSTYLFKVNAKLLTMNEQLSKTLQEREEYISKLKGSSSAARQTNAPPPGTVVEPNKMATSKTAVDEFFKKLDNQ